MAEELSLGDRKAVQTELEKRKENASFIGWVDKKEDKGKKERRILVVATHRLITIRPGGKVARDPHWLELVDVKTHSPSELYLGFKTFKLEITTSAVDAILQAIREAMEAAFPGIPATLRVRMDVQPPSRLKEISPVDLPLGGFIPTYRSLCNFYGVEEREDIIWDMENLFIPGRIKDFDLREFEQPFGFAEVRTLVGALQYNSYFRSLTVTHVTLDKNMVPPIAECLKFNSALDEITFERASLSRDSVALLCDALTFNKTLGLTSLNLAHNNLEDKGGQAIAGYLASLSRGLVKLDLQHCNIGKVGMAAIGNALKKNPHMSASLTHVNFSGNKLDGEGSAALGSFLANPNALR